MLVNNAFVARGGIGWFTGQVFARTALDQLPAHLEQQYGIEVAGVTELDGGVYRVTRDGVRSLISVQSEWHSSF